MALGVVRSLREAGLVVHEPITLRGVSGNYVDVKKGYGDPRLLREISSATVQNISKRTTCIATAGYGGLPLAVEVSRQSGLLLAMVRDTHKNHGTRGLVDGYVPGPEDLVEVVDDVLTTGGSLNQVIEVVGSLGAQVIGCHVVVARGDPESFHVPVSYLCRPEDLL